MALLQCPECACQISDKALSCPHCGFPMTEKSEKRIRSKTKKKHPRLPNGFGQITEIKNKNLRKRFRVMITVSKSEEGQPICKLLRPNAYFSTYNEAYTALIEYNNDPYDLDSIITFSELYKRWSEKKYKTCSPSTARQHKSAWSYCTCLYDMKVSEIRARHLKKCIEEPVKEIPSTTKGKMKNLMNLLMDYAVEYDLTDKNYARTFSLSPEILKEMEANKKDHIAFKDDELEKMWQNRDKYQYLDYILFQCYSGLRPTELCLIKISDVHLDEDYFVGGIKTEAGFDRIIPIHPKVKDIAVREYNRAKDLNSAFLFNKYSDKKYKNPKLSYNGYSDIFSRLIEALDLNPEHRPHDPRKTFITMAKKYKMDEYALKRIVGHDIDDITEEIYTERDIDWYLEEVQKIK